MPVRFDSTRQHAKLSQIWQGAAFKQGGHYFGPDGQLVITSNSPPPDAPMIGEGAPVEAAGPTVVFQDGNRGATINGVAYVRLDVATATVSQAVREALATHGQQQELHNQNPATVPPPAGPATEPPLPAPKAGDDDLEAIRGIGAALVTKLHAMGIRTFRDLVSLSPEEVESVEATINRPGAFAREKWVDQAVALIAAANPDAVVKSAVNDDVTKTALTLDDLKRWARQEGELPAWPAVRQAFVDLLAVRPTREGDAQAALVKSGHLAIGEGRWVDDRSQ